ncbi:hypothetical protein A2154_05155 [Candidatus Gottesmanbacteria bacterium RBG_16_43_7]|uniref:Uncharacterized protein n=1 Tax=Candidatus Gottesmanbacteria bacterium RBG_16_43_7 TaxID=1798373 RepID=A0A1F5ZBY3_9BACT|nr:MAG: hypothetical protein A2154_05155 [Candidatus Gottesmanbacteria bacterium RBG_16_43_7]
MPIPPILIASGLCIIASSGVIGYQLAQIVFDRYSDRYMVIMAGWLFFIGIFSAVLYLGQYYSLELLYLLLSIVVMVMSAFLSGMITLLTTVYLIDKQMKLPKRKK